MYTADDLDYELKKIKDTELRTFVKGCLMNAPEYFYTMPASTTGKFHPAYCLGEGGLVRHVKATVRLAEDLFRLEQYENVDRDLVFAALILHDIVKKDPVKNETSFLHPFLGASFVIQEGIFADTKLFDKVMGIARLIQCHMGQWTTSHHEPDVVLPKPQEIDEHLVHLCDYLASRKDITVEMSEDD